MSLELGVKKKEYKIDFDEVRSIEDVIAILKAVDPVFTWYSEEVPEKFLEPLSSGLLKSTK